MAVVVYARRALDTSSISSRISGRPGLRPTLCSSTSASASRGSRATQRRRMAACDRWVGLGVPLSFFGRAAQDAVSRAWDHVGYAFRVLSVEHETFEAGVAHAHDLTHIGFIDGSPTSSRARAPRS